ncbi:MAG: tripartite tricarboxylate transporter substrate binding protein [Burkholderiales bacterium]|nr:tripartite tricarboxylate transporter substrate binding protein [Burkholderiales bacterium]
MSYSLTQQARNAALAALACAALLGAAAAHAQTDKVTKLILPVAAGSGVDTITRASSKALATALGTAVVIENQPGAGGIVGTQALVKSAPDGATLSVVSNNHVIYPSVYKSLPFDPIKDITPIAVMGTTPLVLVVNPKVAAKDAKELVALLKAKPDGLNYASSGNGTILHLAAEMFLDEANVKAKHIPYKGVGPMVTDLLGGQVDFGVLALPSIQAHLKSGALRAIGTSSKARLAAAPEIATFAEQGLPGYIVEGWFAVIAPRGLPAAEVKRVNAAFTTAFASSEVKEAMGKQGNSITIQSPEQSAEFFKSELEKYAKLVKKAGVKLD